ncbi:hypothetical protein [Bombella favorum]|uniref:STAS domain-containing protein n=1 Tax=Bombella favorum TaxID=2039164 RepID=A0ABR5ZNL2_9PROT|nr:hypothetical protein [Bombella favorum]MBA5725849.1 hypothetical protein [Bombella favorum]
MAEAVQGGSPLISLPQRLDTSAAAGLKALLLEETGAAAGAVPLLDASAVDYVGGLCLQLLLASGLKVGPCSEKAAEAFALFGVQQQLLEAMDEKESRHDG